MNKRKGMSPTKIRIALLRAGVTQASIARGLGVTRNMVTCVVSGRVVSHRVRQGIAEAIGMKPEDIWPSSYEFRTDLGKLVPRRRGRPHSGTYNRNS